MPIFTVSFADREAWLHPYKDKAIAIKQVVQKKFLAIFVLLKKYNHDLLLAAYFTGKLHTMPVLL